jgi:hypothetical protein
MAASGCVMLSAESNAGAKDGPWVQRFDFKKDFFGYFLSRKESNNRYNLSIMHHFTDIFIVDKNKYYLLLFFLLAQKEK